MIVRVQEDIEAMTARVHGMDQGHGDEEEIETVAIAEIVETIGHKCTVLFVVIVIKDAKFHLNQMEENRFFAAIVSKKVMTDQVQTIPHVNDVRNVQNVHHTIVVLIFQNS